VGRGANALREESRGLEASAFFLVRDDPDVGRCRTSDVSHFTSASLRRAVGDDMFYSIVAELDRPHAAGWLEMVAVQADFAAGEPSYDRATRTYSESMRMTLHWSLVFLFESPSLLAAARRSSGGIFGYFVRLHPTAFKANGACTLNPVGMAEVMFNTRGSMMSLQNIAWITQGLTERYDVAIRAAEQVRTDRRRCGQPVTVDGYREPARMTGLERRMARHGRARAMRAAAR